MIENTISIESTSADNNNYTDMLGETEVHNFSMDQNEEKSAETDDIYTETDTLKDSAEASAANPQEETVELTVYGEKVTVPLSQALAQAQKGIAFERMKEQLNQAKNDLRLKTLERLEQQTGKNAYQLLGDMQHQAISDSFIARYGSFDNVPFEELRQAVKSLEEIRMRLEENRMENSYSNWSSQLEEFMNALLEEYTVAFGGSRNAMFRLKENWGFLHTRFEGIDKLWKRLRKTTDLQEYKSITAEIFHTLPLI